MADPKMQCRGGGNGGEDDGMRTVECLRGRLLAERVASKAAKEEADQLAKKLGELEKKLSDEVKTRDRAERRLRKAIKKLAALKILDVELSDSSFGSLSSNGSVGHQALEMEERKPSSFGSGDSGQSVAFGEAKGLDNCDGNGNGCGGSSAGSCPQVSSQDGSWCSVRSEQSQSGDSREMHLMDPEDTKNCSFGQVVCVGDDSQRLQHVARCEDQSDRDENKLALVIVDHPAVKAGKLKMDSNVQTTTQDQSRPDDDENKLALVLVHAQPDEKPTEPRINDNVQAVLLALRRVKEQLRYSIERSSSPEFFSQKELYGH